MDGESLRRDGRLCRRRHPVQLSCAGQKSRIRGDTQVARPRPNAKRPCFIVSTRLRDGPADYSVPPASAARTLQPVFVRSSGSPRRISKTVTTASTGMLHGGTTAPSETSGLFWARSESSQSLESFAPVRVRTAFLNCQMVFSRQDFRCVGVVALCPARLPPNRHRLAACDHFQQARRWVCPRVGGKCRLSPKNELRIKGQTSATRNPRIIVRQQREQHKCPVTRPRTDTSPSGTAMVGSTGSRPRTARREPRPDASAFDLLRIFFRHRRAVVLTFSRS